ncbi:amidohydrolase [Ornithinimicrobium sp. LYQ121]|uniref:amidohydrolase n=1 Tax=Ornithinimicrobium sp. LYQ121 TaxID=3378801 RepID=UPI003851EE11
MSDLLLRDVRIVPLDGDLGSSAGLPAHGADASGRLVDVLLGRGVVSATGTDIEAPPGTAVVDGAGRWALPGLWDHHVHLTQWASSRSRLDLSGARSVAEAVAVVRHRLALGPLPPTGVLVGFGHRSATWGEELSVAALDRATTAVPVVLISGDAHHGWLNSPALRLLGVSVETTGVLAEGDWFPVYDRLSSLPGARADAESGVGRVIRDAHARGVVGLTDLEFGRPWRQWQERTDAGLPPLRARIGVYPEGLQEVLDAEVRTGDLVGRTDGLVRLGPLKIISDGSLNTRTAWCCEPYADAAVLEHPRGAPNLDGEELHTLLATAHAAGLEVALHAIGDAAVGQALRAFAATGAVGGIEHAQLVAPEDLDRWAGLPVRASVQPAHLLDDRVVTEQCWPDRTGRTFTLRSFLDRGIEVVLGSDAPVAPLDPWLAMAAAVHRGPVGSPSWHPEQALTPQEALAASVDGRRVHVGDPADVVLVDADPRGEPGMTSAEHAAVLLGLQVSATVLDGQVVHGG